MPVVAAVDRSERAAAVVEGAQTLASDAGTELHIVHIGEATLPHYKGGYDKAGATAVSVAKATAAAREIGRDVLGIEQFTAVGLQGDPAEEILEYARKQDAMYIAVSARRQSPLKQTAFGSVTQSLLLNADRPVVSIPPESD